MMPTVASLSEDAMRSVAKGTKEASLALGATRFEMVKQVVFPSFYRDYGSNYISGFSCNW